MTIFQQQSKLEMLRSQNTNLAVLLLSYRGIVCRIIVDYASENTWEQLCASVRANKHLRTPSRANMRQKTLANYFVQADASENTCAHLLARVRVRKYLFILLRARKR